VIRALYPELTPDQIAGAQAHGIRSRASTGSDWAGHQDPGRRRPHGAYAQCCQPVPGDQVVGYVTPGRGISIHRPTAPTCSRSQRTSGGSRSTGRKSGRVVRVRLAVTGDDRRGSVRRHHGGDQPDRPPTLRARTCIPRTGSVFGTIFVEVDISPPGESSEGHPPCEGRHQRRNGARPHQPPISPQRRNSGSIA
jgi:hypothetical protein